MASFGQWVANPLLTGSAEIAKKAGVSSSVTDAIQKYGNPIGTVVDRAGKAVGLIPPDTLAGQAGKELDPLSNALNPLAGDARAIYERQLLEANKAGNFKTPTLGPGVTVHGRTVDANPITGNFDSTAADAAPTERYQAAMAAVPEEATAGNMDWRVSADTLEPAALAGVERVGRAEIGDGASALRGEQLAAIQKLQNQPSAAAAQYKAALGGIAREQLGIASQARGAERAGGRREAMLAIGDQGLDAADRIAAAQIAEQNATNQSILGALGGARGQDAEIATHQADLNQQANQLEAQITAEASRGNAAAVNALKAKQADLRLAAATSTAAGSVNAGNVRGTISAGNADRAARIGIANADAANLAARSGADAANLAGQNAADRATRIRAANADRAATIAQNNQTNALAAGTTTANLGNAADLANQGDATTRAVGQGQLDISGQQVRNAGTQAGLTGAAGAIGTGLDVQGRKLDISKAKLGVAAGDLDREDRASDRLVKGGTAAGAALSDERVKRDVHAVPPEDLEELARAMRAVTYRYKPGVDDGGKDVHAGVLAQDIEGTRLGKTLVGEDEDGVKNVDYRGLAAMMAAAAAPVLRRQREARQ